MSSMPGFGYLLCDLDNTLYPASSGIMGVVGKRITRYMAERLGLPSESVDRTKREYYQQYGTTMRGLILHYEIDPEDYLRFVHDLPIDQYIQPDPALDAMLHSIPLRKAVFTNADHNHAGRVLAALGIGHHFEWVIDVHDFRFLSKPHPSAYLRILEILGAHADECIMVEDVAHNLAPAKTMGMATVLVWEDRSSDECCPDGVDICIANILALAGALAPWLTVADE
jgi:putative hydrolase of the HAD superfamily